MAGTRPVRPFAVVLLVVLCGYFLVAMEWLFFMTKPSFFDSFALLESLEALIVVALAGVVGTVLAMLPMLPALWLTSRMFGADHLRTLLVVPAAVLLVCAVLLVDNFTNTVLGVGISDATGVLRAGYLVALCVGLYSIGKWIHTAAVSESFGRSYRFTWSLAAAVGLGSLAVLANALWQAAQSDSRNGLAAEVRDSSRQSPRPNIVLFAADGITAGFLGTYGNERQTTPNLDSLLDTSLVMDNAFSNAERTTGSVTSMLTGKHPATTKVLFPPHVLGGTDAYQHLPGILKRLGYATFQESVRYYADANDLSLVGGFDLANGIQTDPDAGPILPLPAAVLFARHVTDRILQRLKHVLWIEDMDDVYDAVASDSHAKVYGLSDESRIGKAVAFIRAADAPIFVHLHLMDTHCCNFRPKTASSAQALDEKGLENAILEDLVKASDEHFGRILQALEDSGQLEDTLIVYSSDHSKRWRFRNKVPLVFRFPRGEHAGRVVENAQLLDVAPTVLDYLNIKQPVWMEGQSLLSARDAYRPIFGVTKLTRGHFRTRHKDKLSHIIGEGPPNYGLEAMGLVVCDRWYTHQLVSGKTRSGSVKDYTGACDRDRVPGRRRAAEMMQEHLRDRGFLGD